MKTTDNKPTWKNNGKIRGRENQIELIRSDKYDYRGHNSIIIKGWDCDEVAAIVFAALTKGQ